MVVSDFIRTHVFSLVFKYPKRAEVLSEEELIHLNDSTGTSQNPEPLNVMKRALVPNMQKFSTIRLNHLTQWFLLELLFFLEEFQL